MRGDDTQPISAEAEDELRARNGPRHAAPRKSLLTKLQMPAGKAIALAAMPTAVFVGMGLTPRLALADDSKDIPYAPGPCVTRSDDPAPDDSASPSPSPSDSKSPKPGDSPSASPSPSASDSGGKGTPGGGKDTAEPKPSATSSSPDTGAPKPSADTSGTKDDTSSDLLGVGGLLGGLLGGGSDKAATPSPSATPTDSAATKSDTSTPEATDPVSKLGDGVGKTVGKTLGGTKDTVDATKKAIQDAADKAGAKVEELGDGAKGLAAHKDTAIPLGAGGKEAFPCPTADPKALADAKQEQGIPLLPDDPWTLHSSLLTLNGLDYKGIVEVKTSSGKIKKVLKFTSASLDIKDLDQSVVYPDGKTGHVVAAPGSTSTIRGGEVTMYTEELKGNLFGLIPITFSPQTPPPVNVPFAFFTNVQVTQAGQFGGTLTIPGLHNYVD